MIRALIEGIIYILNSFPSKTGISQTMSPAMIVEGQPKINFSSKMIAFGAYALVYSTTKNTMKGRSTSSIALRMSNNAGGYFYESTHWQTYTWICMEGVTNR